MSHLHTDLLEIILRECAATGPQPWYPSSFCRSTGVPRGTLDSCLDKLRLAGLVQLTPWVQEHGQGYQLTEHGAEVLRQPRLLARLRQGDVPQTTTVAVGPSPRGTSGYRELRLSELRGEKVREALMDDSRPIVTQILVMLNVLYFLVGLAVFVGKFGGQARYYLTGGMFGVEGGQHQFLNATYEMLGWLQRDYLIGDGQWWRLISYGFLHGGLIHLGANMYGLYVLGPSLERWWGRAQYTAIYFIACVGSGAFAMLLTPGAPVVGASGAICGILGSMATWLLLNKNYLPARVVEGLRSNVLTNIFLIAMLSYFMREVVSWAGHLGGGVVGAIVAAPLNLAHFGTNVQRLWGWAGAAGAVLVGLGLFGVLLHKGTDDRTRARLQIKAAARELQQLDRADEVAVEARNRAKKLLAPVKHAWPGDKEAAQLAQEFRQNQQELDGHLAKLKQVEAFQEPLLNDAFKKGVTFIEMTSPFCEKMAQALQSKETWTNDKREVLAAEYMEIGKAYTAFGEAVRKFKKASNGETDE
jgi:rhomboid protease GluP